MREATTFLLGPRDRKRLAARLRVGSRPVSVRTADGEVELPEEAQAAVGQLLSDLAAGSVHLVADDRDLTTQEAADLLGLSRTFIVRLIDSGKLSAHMAGTHRRVRSGDALRYLRERDRRLDAVAMLRDADGAAGVAYR